MTDPTDPTTSTYNTSVAYATCQMNQTYLQADVGCDTDACTVRRLKLIPNPHDTTQSLEGRYIMQYFVDAAGAAAAFSDGAVMTTVERYW